RRHALGLRLQIAHGIGKTPGTRFTHDEHVVTGALHGPPEMHGFDGPILTEDALEGLQIIGGGKAHALQIDRNSQLLWQQTKRTGFAHQTSFGNEVNGISVNQYPSPDRKSTRLNSSHVKI